MSQRDELAREVFAADNYYAPDPYAEWGNASTAHRDYAYTIADGLLANGYRKPRTITTVEELDALPDRSVVLTRHGQSIQIMRDIKPDLEWWHYIIKDAGSATVLHEPEAPHAD